MKKFLTCICFIMIAIFIIAMLYLRHCNLVMKQELEEMREANEKYIESRIEYEVSKLQKIEEQNNIETNNFENENIKECAMCNNDVVCGMSLNTSNSEEIIENKKYTDEDLYVLSHVIYAEAGNCSREMQIGVGSVVLNRVKDERFPNTIKDVVFQKGQYACTWDGNYEKEPNQESIDIAIELLENGSQYPDYVIWQASFKQGDSIYKQVENIYFCYWNEDAK